jgi:hypothetical protein
MQVSEATAEGRLIAASPRSFIDPFQNQKRGII